DPVGSAGGPVEGAMDFGASDDRIAPLAYDNPDHYPGGGNDFVSLHMVCALNYFSEPLRSDLLAKMGVPGRGPRIGEPRCGEIMQDVAGTAQGRWFADQTTTEDHHLALVHDLQDPSVPVFSVGSTLATLPPGVYTFAPAASGRVNREP